MEKFLSSFDVKIVEKFKGNSWGFPAYRTIERVKHKVDDDTMVEIELKLKKGEREVSGVIKMYKDFIDFSGIPEEFDIGGELMNDLTEIVKKSLYS